MNIQTGKIELTPTEQELYNSLESFKISLDEDYEKRLEKLDNCFLLIESLAERNAIPDQRWKYFIDPKYNLSNKKTSRLATFERNGTSGIEIFKHPNFLRYLKYIVDGSDLPETLKSELQRLRQVESYESDFIEKAVPIFKSYYMRFVNKANKSAFAEEVFKFSLDLGLDFSSAEDLRNRIMRMR